MFSAKICFVKTSTGIVKYQSWVVKLNSDYYINLRSSIMFCCLKYIYIYLFVGISLSSLIFSALFVTVSELFCSEVLEAFVIFFNNFIANQITSCFSCFLNCFVGGCLQCIHISIYQTFLAMWNKNTRNLQNCFKLCYQQLFP